MRVRRAAAYPWRRLAALAALIVMLVGIAGGGVWWCWTQAALLLELHTPERLPLTDAARAGWRLLLDGGWAHPSAVFPTRAERVGAPGAAQYGLVLLLVTWGLVAAVLRLRRWLRAVSVGSPVAGRGGIARWVRERGWVSERTWGAGGDLRRLWVVGPVSGRPYLGFTGGLRRRRLAAELEVQPMVVAPPRAGKTSGFVIPWLLEHDGPALVLSTKRDVYEATAEHRRSVGRVWVYDPFGAAGSAGFSPLVPAVTWPGAIRAGEALASAAHPDASSAAHEFWDKRPRACSRRSCMPPRAAAVRSVSSCAGSTRATSRMPSRY